MTTEELLIRLKVSLNKRASCQTFWIMERWFAELAGRCILNSFSEGWDNEDRAYCYVCE